MARAARALLADLPAMAEEVARRLVARDVFYQACFTDIGADFFDELVRSARTHMGQALRALAGDEPVDFELTRGLAKERAEQGVPIASLLFAYRTAAELYWERIVAPGWTVAFDPVAPESVLDATAQVWSLAGAFNQVISDAYLESVTDHLRRSEQDRARAVHAVFEGVSPASPPLGQVATQLDLPVQADFVMAVIGSCADGGPGADLEARFATAGMRSVWRRTTTRLEGVLVLDAPVADLRSTVARVVDGPASIRIGISPRYRALTDSPDHLALAELALRCTSPADPVVAYDDRPLAALVAAAPDVARRSARVVLGGVLDLPPSSREVLLETLGAWLDSAGSLSAAAERLYCHRNTVRNRLVRVEEVSGRSLQDPMAVAEVASAILALRTAALDDAG